VVAPFLQSLSLLFLHCVTHSFIEEHRLQWSNMMTCRSDRGPHNTHSCTESQQSATEFMTLDPDYGTVFHRT